MLPVPEHDFRNDNHLAALYGRCYGKWRLLGSGKSVRQHLADLNRAQRPMHVRKLVLVRADRVNSMPLNLRIEAFKCEEDGGAVCAQMIEPFTHVRIVLVMRDQLQSFIVV